MPHMPRSPARLNPVLLSPVVAYLYFLIRFPFLAYFAVGAVVLGGFFALFFGWGRVEKSPLGMVALVLIGLGLPALGILQFYQLRDLGDIDQASYACALWNLRHGMPHYTFWDKNMFGIHCQYTSVLWIPLHYLAGEVGLKLGKSLCLLAATFLAVRRYWGNRQVAAWAAVAILLSPPVASQFFFGFHPEFIGAPILVLALWAYRDQKLGLFLACTAFLAYSKETYTLAIGGILLLALVEKRPWKWVLIPGVLCCILMGVFWYVILPRFAPAGNHLASYMPTFGQILGFWWRPQNLGYLVHIGLPFLPLMLAFPLRYMLLPLPLMVFYAAFSDPLFVTTWAHYGFPLAFLCAAGLVLGQDPDSGKEKELEPESEHRPDRPSALPAGPWLDGRILLSCATISILSFPLGKDVFAMPLGNLARSRQVDRLHDMIPWNASVLVNAPFSARFSARKEVCFWAYRDQPFNHFDYIVIDAALPYWLNDAKGLSDGIHALSNDPAWTREYGKDSLFLFRHIPAPLVKVKAMEGEP